MARTLSSHPGSGVLPSCSVLSKCFVRRLTPWLAQVYMGKGMARDISSCPALLANMEREDLLFFFLK